MRKQQLNNLNYSEAVALGQKENNKYNPATTAVKITETFEKSENQTIQKPQLLLFVYQ